MPNIVKTGLGGSRLQKESEKNFYWKPEILVPGSGVNFEFVDIDTKAELDSAMQDPDGRMMYPQASQTLHGLRISATDVDVSLPSGYTGYIATSGTHGFHVVNGIITTYA